MDLLHNIYTGFTIAFTGQNLLCCAVGVLFGQLIGVLPGIGAPTAIALLLPLTFSFNPTSAIIMFAGIYYGVAYGGTITSILINVPGESSSVMTCVDELSDGPEGTGGGRASRSRPSARLSPGPSPSSFSCPLPRRWPGLRSVSVRRNTSVWR